MLILYAPQTPAALCAGSCTRRLRAEHLPPVSLRGQQRGAGSRAGLWTPAPNGCTLMALVLEFPKNQGPEYGIQYMIEYYSIEYLVYSTGYIHESFQNQAGLNIDPN